MAEHWDRLPRKVVESSPFSGEIQNPPERIPMSPALGDAALSRVLDCMISRNFFQL